MYIYFNTWMWHYKKNSQLKKFLPLYTVLLIYSEAKASQILHGGAAPAAPSKNWIKSIYSFDQKNISYVTVWEEIFGAIALSYPLGLGLGLR